MFPLAVIFLLAGFALYFLARRGFSSGTHPVCAACAYDLHMLPPDTQRCPECGADILQEKNIRIGQRRPSLAGMLAGCILALAGLGICGLGIAGWWKTFDGTRHMTAGMLQSRITSADAAMRERVCGELRRRIRAHDFSPAHMDALAQAILRLQSDPAVHWDLRWGDIMECAHQAKNPGGSPLLAEARWRQFLLAAMQTDVAVRPRVTAGNGIPLRVRSLLKAGADPTLAGIAFSPEVQVRMAHATQDLSGDPRRTGLPGAPMDWIFHCTPPAERAAAGTREFDIRLTMKVLEGGQVIDRTLEFTQKMEIVNGPSVTLHTPASERERQEFEAAVQWRLKERNGSIMPAFGELGSLWISGPTVAAAFRVVLRQGGREWRLARFMVQPDAAQSVPLQLPATTPGDGPQPGAAEIICIPDPTPAEGTVDVMEIWGGEIRRPVTLLQVQD